MMQRTLLASMVAIASIGWSSAAFSQVPPEPPGQARMNVSFEVVSVKEDHRSRQEALRPTLNMLPSGYFRASWVTLGTLIMTAYDVRAYEIVDGPEWMASDRFDIVAQAPDGFEMSHTRAMMRKLLEERFGLVARWATRRIPTYTLQWPGRSRRPGPGIRPPSCDGFPMRATQTLPAGRAGGPAREPDCESVWGFGVGWIFVRRGTLASLARSIDREVGRPVIDKTGLKGLYDVDLKWSPDPQLEFAEIPDGVSVPPSKRCSASSIRRTGRSRVSPRRSRRSRRTSGRARPRTRTRMLPRRRAADDVPAAPVSDSCRPLKRWRSVS
jgi:uncharacterized protein (TIGR03435 family)